MEDELGKTEEEVTTPNPSSAELSELETAPTPDVEHSPATEVDAPAPVARDETPNAEPADNAASKPASPFKRGAMVSGTVTATTPTQITLDLGDGHEGVILSSELEKLDKKRLEDFAIGNTLNVVVVNPRNKDGLTVLSYIHALEETDWQTAEEYRQSKQVFHGKVGGYNKGGLIVRFGRLRGFVPQSQISDVRLSGLEGETPEQRYSSQINKNVDVKVMEVDRARNRLILSERAALRDVRKARKEALITQLQVGEIREGVVVSLENFGAFIDIGGAEGLAHLTEISHHHITHPRQSLMVGEKVTVKVKEIDVANNRIALTIKELLPDPWDEIAARYSAGTLVRGTITKLTKFGAFARIEGTNEPIEGLIHISELSEERVEHPSEVVKRGDVLTLRVVRVEIADKRLGLSLKKVNSAEFLDEDLRQAFENPERVEIPEVKKPTAAQRAREALEDAREKGAEVIETLKEKAGDAREAIADAVEALQEKASDVIDDAREALSDVVEAAREKGEEVIERLKGDDDSRDAESND
jgi:small subunit ribosomal protein S1